MLRSTRWVASGLVLHLLAFDGELLALEIDGGEFLNAGDDAGEGFVARMSPGDVKGLLVACGKWPFEDGPDRQKAGITSRSFF